MEKQYQDITTPALLVDRTVLMENIARAQEIADKNGVNFRPHTKTHKSPYIAKLQCEAGACGIAVAKTEEAEIMAENGLTDIFIANEPVGKEKWERLAKLNSRVTLSFGVDCKEHLLGIEEAFGRAGETACVLAEIEVGENRSGVTTEEGFRELLKYAAQCPHIKFKGIFSHDGFSYGAATEDEARAIGEEAQRKTLRMAEVMREEGIRPEVVSIGSTTSVLLGCRILPGITEIRIGTYIYMDGSQANAIGDNAYKTCAASVLLSVMSKPTKSRVTLDGGAKSLTMQKRTKGLTTNAGMGELKDFHVHIVRMNDEHAVVEDEAFSAQVAVGDKVQVIPNHICPAVNLYRKFYLVEKGQILGVYPVSCGLATE